MVFKFEDWLNLETLLAFHFVTRVYFLIQLVLHILHVDLLFLAAERTLDLDDLFGLVDIPSI